MAPRTAWCWSIVEALASATTGALGHGGVLLIDTRLTGIDVRDARTGDLLAALPSGLAPSLDGRRYWVLGTDGVLVGTDAYGVLAPIQFRVAESCAFPRVTVRGRWALSRCGPIADATWS